MWVRPAIPAVPLRTQARESLPQELLTLPATPALRNVDCAVTLPARRTFYLAKLQTASRNSLDRRTVYRLQTLQLILRHSRRGKQRIVIEVLVWRGKDEINNSAPPLP